MTESIPVSSSILNSTKKVLGLDPDYDVFDLDVLMHINTAFGTLSQLGVGPAEGFMVEDDSVTWDAFLGADLRLNQVKSYVYLRVRMLFDPPATAALMEATKAQIQEFEWRLNLHAEGAFNDVESSGTV